MPFMCSLPGVVGHPRVHTTHGRIADPPPLQTNSDLAWTKEYDEPPPSHTISNLAWTWKDDWPPTLTHSFRIGQTWKDDRPPHPLQERPFTCEGNSLFWHYFLPFISLLKLIMWNINVKKGRTVLWGNLWCCTSLCLSLGPCDNS